MYLMGNTSVALLGCSARHPRANSVKLVLINSAFHTPDVLKHSRLPLHLSSELCPFLRLSRSEVVGSRLQAVLHNCPGYGILGLGANVSTVVSSSNL